MKKVLFISKIYLEDTTSFVGSEVYQKSILAALKEKYSVEFLYLQELPASYQENLLLGKVRCYIKNFLQRSYRKVHQKFPKFAEKIKDFCVAKTVDQESVKYFESPANDSEIRFIQQSLCDKYFDAVIVNYTNLANLFDFEPLSAFKEKIILTNDIWHNRLQQCLELGIECKNLELWTLENEIKFWEKATTLVAIQKTEHDKIEKLCDKVNVITTPVAFEKKLNFVNKSDLKNIIIFLGGKSDINKDSLNYFLTEVFPLVRASIPDAELRVCGGVSDYYNSDVYKNVKFLGKVADLSYPYRHAKLSVVPVRAGTGLKIKLVESFAFATPVVTTSIGLEGCEDAENSCVLCANDALLMSEHIIKLLSDDCLLERMSVACTSYLERNFSLDATSKDLYSVLDCIPPMISVVMTVYNDINHLRESVESILNQTYGNFEFIIVNEFGYDDGSIDLLQSFNDDRIIIIQNTEKKGFSASLNIGFKAARGKYIARMDGDDISDLRRLEIQVSYLESNPDVHILGCWYKFFGDRSHIYKGEDNIHQCNSDIVFYNNIPHGGLMLRTESFIGNNLFYDEDSSVEDHELWIRCVLDYKLNIKILPQVLFLYRWSENNISINKHEAIQQESVCFAYKFFEKLDIHIDDDLKSLLRPWDYYLFTRDKEKFESDLNRLRILFATALDRNKTVCLLNNKNLKITFEKKIEQLKNTQENQSGKIKRKIKDVIGVSVVKSKILNIIRRICGTVHLESLPQNNELLAQNRELLIQNRELLIQRTQHLEYLSTKIIETQYSLQLELFNAQANKSKEVFLTTCDIPPQQLRLERTKAGELCFRSPSKDNFHKKPIVVVTLPKAGTYLIAKLLSHLGYDDAGVHVGSSVFSDYRSTKNDTFKGKETFLNSMPFAAQLQLVKSQQFCVGHVEAAEAVNCTNNLVILAVRDLRTALVSCMRFQQDTKRASEKIWGAAGFNESSLNDYMDDEAGYVFHHMKQLILWKELFPNNILYFEELATKYLSPELTSVQNLSNLLERTPQEIIDALSEVRGKQTRTYSGKISTLDGIWSDRVEEKFQKFGGHILNKKFGYPDFWEK